MRPSDDLSVGSGTPVNKLLLFNRFVIHSMRVCFHAKSGGLIIHSLLLSKSASVGTGKYFIKIR